MKRLVRTFSFDGTATFRVEDDVELAAPRRIEWRLQADLPFAVSGEEHVTGGPASPVLAVRFLAPSAPEVRLDFTRVKTPGRPGAIESGAAEERAYQLVALPPGKQTSARLEAILTVEPARFGGR